MSVLLLQLGSDDQNVLRFVMIDRSIEERSVLVGAVDFLFVNFSPWAKLTSGTE